MTIPQLDPGQLLLSTQERHFPTEQNPLTQSSPAAHGSLLSSLQRSP